MSLTTTSRAELRSDESFTRFCELVADVPPDIRVGDRSWSVGDVTRHMLSVVRRYTIRDLNSRDGLSPTVRDVTELNSADVEALEHLSHADLLDALHTEWSKYLALDVIMEDKVPFHFGATIDGFGALGNMLAELLIHGYDVATAAKRIWPIEDRDALLALNGVLQIAPVLADPVRTARVRAEIEFRIGDGRPQVVTIDRARCRIADATSTDGRRDVIVGGPPEPVLLNLYQRIGLLAAIRRGVRLHGGRRPWLIVQFKHWFLMP
ncbi:maleylpyruvate isomerase N-terminal domain-containing protein [Rhodococcus opacus]|uniref:maleylpyruvate isomerase N-terminal domain-containing protein n=1 Tax=Rhodococcus opacus TaxID=37919 RepID=UPI00155B1423|nr:maleylpyruvate isomerase N-terminal domain-containing protein [Rhodococcus opacus]